MTLMFKRLGILFMLGIIGSSLLVGLLPYSTQSVSAATENGRFKDNSTIEYKGANYIDITGDNDSGSYIKEKDPTDCTGNGQEPGLNTKSLYKPTNTIRDINSAKNKANHIVYEARYYHAASNRVLTAAEYQGLDKQDIFRDEVRCIQTSKEPITLTGQHEAGIEYAWRDEDHIERTDGTRMYTKDSNGEFVWKSDDNKCKEKLKPNNDATAILSHHGKRNVADTTCIYETDSIFLGDTANSTKAGGTGTTADGSTTADLDKAEDDKPSCESGGGELSWILCPMLRGASSFLQYVDEKLNKLLSLPSAYYNNDKLRETWARMRNLAYAILIPIMLIMVISTALGFDFVSAYTFKKALPRLVIAIIFMALSFEITKFLIILTNDVGKGLLGLMTSSFTGGGEITIASLFNPGGGAGATATFGVILAGVLAPGLIAVLLLQLFMAAMSLLIALLALAFRQMLLIMFMVLAPLAILAWIFPGNDKMWKLWWGSFSKLLLLYPIIMILIGSGRAFAWLVQSAGGDDVLATILKLTAYVAPYFFIPTMFKLAGGVFATITGMTNDKSKGLFDRTKKLRNQKAGEAYQRGKNDNFLKGGNDRNLRGKLNRMVSTGANINKAGLRPTNWSTNLATARGSNAQQEIEHNKEKNADYAPFKFDDDVNRAASESHDAESLRAALRRADQRLVSNGKDARFSTAAEMEQVVSRVQRVRKAMSTDGFRQMTTTQALAGGTAYDTAGEAWAAVAAAGGNDDAATARMVNEGRSVLMSTGRVDQGGASFGATLGSVRRMQDELRQTGNISAATMAAENRVIHKNVYASQGGATLVHSSMKASAVEEMAPEIIRTVTDAVASGDSRSTAQSLASLGAVYDGMVGSSPEKAKIMADKVMRKEIDFGSLSPDLKRMLAPAMAETQPDGSVSYRTSGPITFQRAIETLRSNPEFQEMRREYQTQVEAAARAGGPPPPGTTPGALGGRVT